MTWDEDNQYLLAKKTICILGKRYILTAQWHSPIGDAPAITAEQQSQNDAGTHGWEYIWNESGQSWDLTDRLA